MRTRESAPDAARSHETALRSLRRSAVRVSAVNVGLTAVLTGAHWGQLRGTDQWALAGLALVAVLAVTAGVAATRTPRSARVPVRALTWALFGLVVLPQGALMVLAAVAVCLRS